MVEPLTLPSCFDHDRVVRLRESASLGQSIPAELWHCLEVLGPWAAQAPGVHPTDGAVACSPAATAVWAAGPVPAEVTQASVRYLAAAQERYLGPVPSVVPNTSFERAWVRAAIVRAQYSLPTPHSLLDSLAESLSEGAIGCAPGLPADADTTSTTLFALVSAGRPVDPDILLPFESDSRFCNQVGERASSTVANAHVLEALGEHGERHPARAKRYRSSIAKAEQWLIESQAADGSWTDPRHASRYFATTHCVRALARYASPVAQNAVRKALAWIISTQRPDGGWGRWASTTEETAYALQAIYGITVGVAGDPMGDARRYAADRGYVFLRSTGDLMTDEQYSPLWQDKDLYAPVAIIRAEIASALLLAERQTVTERVAS